MQNVFRAYMAKNESETDPAHTNLVDGILNEKLGSLTKAVLLAILGEALFC
jgi:hypothetical protein